MESQGFFLPLLPAQKLVQAWIFEIERKAAKEREAQKIHEQRPTHIAIKKPTHNVVRNGREMEVM